MKPRIGYINSERLIQLKGIVDNAIKVSKFTDNIKKIFLSYFALSSFFFICFFRTIKFTQ